MKIIRRAVLTPFILLLAGHAGAVTTKSYDLNVSVEAQVPDKSGLVVSPVGDWAGKTQKMFWDDLKDQLKPVRNQLHIKSGLGGPVKAWLAAPPVMAADNKNITLDITINGKVLDMGASKSVDILTKEDALVGKVVNFIISPEKSTVYAEGDYFGQIQTVFESSDI
jgi:hypothetical protein